MGVGSAVRETGSSLATVFRRRSLRRLNLALAGSMIGDWAYATAVTVWAYDVGGAAAVGVWATIRLALSAVIAPFAAALADRYPRRTVMVVSDLVRAVLVTLAAVLIWSDVPALLVFVVATVSSLSGLAFRPCTQAIIPSLVEEPKELTAANAVGSTLESLAFFVGPAIAAFLLVVADVPTVFLVNTATFLLSAALIAGVRPRTASVAAPAVTAPAGVPVLVDGPGPVDGTVDGAGPVEAPVPTGGVEVGVRTAETPPDEPSGGFLREALEGFRVVGRSRELTLIMVAYCAQTVLAGASVVFAVVIAFDLLDLGAAGLGYLDSTLGLGAVAGGFLAVGLATRKRLASDFGWGVVFWAVPLLLIAAWPTPAVVFLAMAIIGAANPVVDINASTIIQRLAPDAVLGRVFGALESGLIGTMALGSLLMPILVSTVGLRWGLVVLAVPIIALGLAVMPRLRRLDSTVSEPEGVALLGGVPLFAPLARPLLETLAGALTRVDVPAGTTVVTEGEVGDRFYVVSEGRLDAVHAGAVLSTMRQGECFGEIALLSDVPRTATVTATTDAVLYALDREEFLGAMSGDAGLRSRTESLAARRIPTT